MEKRFVAPESARRTVRAAKERTGLASVRNLILLGVLLAAGAVLKLFLSSYFTVMKPNFVIAMYCLAILLIRPKLREGAIIGVLAGAICQFFPGTPYINLVSEIFGALAMVLLCRLPLRAGRFDLIFNTVPHLLFPESVLRILKTDVCLIDLASKPGGVDFYAAEQLDVNCIWALSLPGKVAPRTAGDVILGAIKNMIEEENM